MLIFEVFLSHVENLISRGGGTQSSLDSILALPTLIPKNYGEHCAELRPGITA